MQAKLTKLTSTSGNAPYLAEITITNDNGDIVEVVPFKLTDKAPASLAARVQAAVDQYVAKTAVTTETITDDHAVEF